MRFSLTLEADEPNSSIPINYQYPFSSWIYNTMNQGNPEFADFLHNKGYTDENKKFRLFCFSNLRMAKYRLEGDRLFLLENPQKLIISFYPLEALEPFVLGLFKNQEFSIGDRTGKTGFKVKSIEKLAEPEFKNCMEFSLLSPVHMARRNPFDSSQVDHLHPEHSVHRFINAIEQKKQFVLKEYQSGNSATIRDKKFRNNKLLSNHRGIVATK